MVPRIDDRWLWLGFSVFLVTAAWRIRHAIQDIVALTLIDPAQYDRRDDENEKAGNANHESGDPEDCTFPKPSHLSTIRRL